MKVDLDGGEWAEIRDLDQLTGADQDDYADTVDALLEVRRREAEAAVQAANPAVMADPQDPPRARLRNPDMRALRDTLLGKLVTDWSYQDRLPLPYHAGYRSQLPLPACNTLVEAIEPHISALNGEAPKKKGPLTGSAGISPETT